MKQIKIHVETRINAQKLGVPYEVSHLQVKRAFMRPLIVAAERGGCGLAKVVNCSKRDGIVIKLRRDSRWQNGNQITARDVEAGINRGLDSHPSISTLLGIHSDQVSCLDNRTIAIRPQSAHDLVVRFLEDIRFSPYHTSGWKNGAFRPIRPHSFVSLRGRRGIHFSSIGASSLALQKFEQQELSMTCPAAFEIAKLSKYSSSLRWHETDIHAVLLINQLQCPSIISKELACAVSDSLELPSDIKPVFIPYRFGDRLVPSHSFKNPDRPLRCLFVDSWPNRELVYSLRSVMEKTGITALRPTPEGLFAVRRKVARMDFDLALILIVGWFGPFLSMPLIFAAAAHKHLARRPVVHRALWTPTDSEAVLSMLMEAISCVPALPIGRLRGGYFAVPSIPDVPLASGGIYPVELLDSAIHDN